MSRTPTTWKHVLVVAAVGYVWLFLMVMQVAG